jgi:hypothetical protein
VEIAVEHLGNGDLEQLALDIRGVLAERDARAVPHWRWTMAEWEEYRRERRDAERAAQDARPAVGS